MALDGDGQRELVDEVHGGAGDDGAATEVLQAEHCGGSERGSQMTRVKPWGQGAVMGKVSGGGKIRLWRGSDHGEGGQKRGVPTGGKGSEVLRDLGA